jgi:RNA polymerase sigma-70 factor, ECF subfamily
MKHGAPRSAEPAWESHRRALHRFVRSRGPEPAESEDIVQEVLSRAVARRDTLRDPRKLRQWLYQIARNAVADHYRSQKSFVGLTEDLAAEPEEVDGKQSLARCLPPFTERLPPAYRRAVRLSELEGRTQRETAEILGLSFSGTKSRIQRARGMLAAMLRECCDLEFDARGALIGYEPRQSGQGTDCRGDCD